MQQLPTLAVKGADRPVILIQGGMGIGADGVLLAGSVSRRGAIGTLSSAGIATLVLDELGLELSTFEAMAWKVRKAKKEGGFIAVNIMVALARTFRDSVLGAIEGGANAIISGAGLPTNLPEITGNADIALIPIVSSLKALRIIHKRWQRYQKIPDAVVVEGPLAGGHLGFHQKDLPSKEHSLEEIFPPIKDFALANGDFPVIVAGGIYTREDIIRWINIHGADGVQMGTRFLATIESGASKEFKEMICQTNKPEKIIVADQPGSPCGLPFRVLLDSPGYQRALAKKPNPPCKYGYVLQKDSAGKYTRCPAKNGPDHFCICTVLLSAAGREDPQYAIYTTGTNAFRIREIIPVDTLMDELTGVHLN
jgi:nitronate monooxygenase